MSPANNMKLEITDLNHQKFDDLHTILFKDLKGTSSMLKPRPYFYIFWRVND